jgi:hypothetical protein
LGVCMAGGTIKIVTSGNVSTVVMPLEALFSSRMRKGMALAVNHTLGKVETQVGRAVVKQTGLKYGAVKSAMKRYSANASTLRGEIVGRGPYIALKEFGARKTKKGVSAAPWATRRVFPHTFFVKAFGGNVFKRKGKKRFPIKGLYGPAIPKEMVKDESARVFGVTVATQLPPRVQHELARLIK